MSSNNSGEIADSLDRLDLAIKRLNESVERRGVRVSAALSQLEAATLHIEKATGKELELDDGAEIIERELN